MSCQDLEAGFLRAVARQRLRKGGLTQEAAAVATGTSRWHMSRVMRGHRISLSLCRRVIEWAERRAA